MIDRQQQTKMDKQIIKAILDRIPSNPTWTEQRFSNNNIFPNINYWTIIKRNNKDAPYYVVSVNQNTTMNTFCHKGSYIPITEEQHRFIQDEYKKTGIPYPLKIKSLYH